MHFPLSTTKMKDRTFIRTMLDILFKNAIAKTIASLVHFCNEQTYYNRSGLKFFKNLPNNNIAKENHYQNKFLFTNSAQYKIGTK